MKQQSAFHNKVINCVYTLETGVVGWMDPPLNEPGGPKMLGFLDSPVQLS